jgi:DNA-binding transcriptional LysR family regulator
MINFNQLRNFYQVAKNLNFTVAANKLFITQPAVSAQIKLFEDYCKLKLFKKKGRKVYLTDEGEALYSYARKIFEYEREIESAIEDMRELKRGILRLGTTKTYARYFMPSLISTFHDTYPHIKLSPNHKLAGKKTISIRDLAREPIIMKEKGSGTRKLVTELFAKKSLTPNILMETSNTEFIKQLVMRGDGISFLVKAAVTAELSEKKLATVSMKGQKIFLDVSIAYHNDQHLSPSAKAFLNILLKIAPKEKASRGIGGLMDKIMSQEKGKI